MKNIEGRKDRYSLYKEYYAKPNSRYHDKRSRSLRSSSVQSRQPSSKRSRSFSRYRIYKTTGKFEGGKKNIHDALHEIYSDEYSRYRLERRHEETCAENGAEDSFKESMLTGLQSRKSLLRYGKPEEVSSNHTKQEKPSVSPEKPNFEPSGALLEESNLKNGVLVKYTEPLEARLPSEKWRIYVFKESDKEKESKVLYLHRCSCFIIGKEPRVAEIVLVHPTISKQHAVIQFRLHQNGSVCPYLIDLESTNGSFLNGEKIEPLRYYELRHGDSLRFGYSTRDLILTKESEVQGKKLTYADYVQLEVNAYASRKKEST